jgi:zinc protease
MGFSQVNFNLPVPVDSAARVGKLPNGITYYIRHNEEPKERASFYMIQNVGALLENDDQNGLAHFLEHMAFNGTEHFPDKGIINTLEKHGVQFGRNINAYTSFGETVYNLSDIPVKHEGLIDTCLLVLNDWADYLLLTDKEIDAERGVISEEWRTRRTAGFRLQRQFLPVLLQGSKYMYRDVIGDLDVIKNFKYQTLRDFYTEWYRTDLQAIAIVGDIDVDAVEAKVKALLSQIKPIENTKACLFACKRFFKGCGIIVVHSESAHKFIHHHGRGHLIVALF